MMLNNLSKTEKNQNSRRGFIKAASLSGLSIISIPSIDAFSEPIEKVDKDKNLTFLFQGDSITDGNRGRDNDPNHIMGHGYAFSIASRVGADFPEKNLKFFNRGISGNRIIDLESRWQKDTLDLKPDVLSILVGINDTNSVINQYNQVTPEQYEEVYKSLVKKTKENLPGVMLVFCEPFILPGGRVKEKWDQWQSDVKRRQEIVKKLSVEHNAIFVGLQDVFDKASKKASPDYWIWDGIHPTVAGHELITRKWLNEVSKELPFLSKYSERSK